MELSATAKVILGLLRLKPRSGYEIKQLVDRSTRFFWAASYGQIYPELRRLEQAALIVGTQEPTGDRARTVYELTEAGEESLLEWLRVPPVTCELRHEGLLKVFLADALPAEERAQVLLDMRDQHAEKLAQLRRVEAGVPPEAADDSTVMALRFGIEFNEWAAEWCERAARRLSVETTPRRP